MITSKGGEFDRSFLDYEIERLEGLAADLRRLRDGWHPSPAELSIAPSIDQWEMANRTSYCLFGLVQGHPYLASLKRSVTSDIEAINFERGYCRTRSRLYALGLRRGETSGGSKQ